MPLLADGDFVGAGGAVGAFGAGGAAGAFDELPRDIVECPAVVLGVVGAAVAAWPPPPPPQAARAAVLSATAATPARMVIDLLRDTRPPFGSGTNLGNRSSVLGVRAFVIGHGRTLRRTTGGADRQALRPNVYASRCT
jgi:hypothetical protein